MHKATRNCPICRTTIVETLHSLRLELPDGHPLSQGYNVVNCLSCGFVYADTSNSQSDYDRYYAKLSKYEDPKTGTGGGENAFDLTRLEITAHQIADFLIDPLVSIIDVGCANGGLLKALKNMGFNNLCGLDPSHECVKNTNALGIEAYPGSLFQYFPHGRFDCVVLSHTLEHVHDLHKAINWISAMLKPDGKNVTYIEVPDASRYFDFVIAPFQDFNTEHINHFSQICLENLMCLAEYDLLETGSKINTIADGICYPVIHGFWKKGDAKSVGKYLPDTQLVINIREYIHRSQEILDEIEVHLKKVLFQNPKVIVWGAGQLTMKLLVETSLGKADIMAFVDSNPINQGQILHGVKILPPDVLMELRYPILISSILHQNEITAQIQKMCIPNPIIYLL